MQGLRALYDYQGRLAEWSRLVAEITPDYCSAADAPILGREGEYSLVMEYRVALARHHQRDLLRAASLQGKQIAWSRQQAAAALAIPLDAPLDDDQCHHIRSLVASLSSLGQILEEQGNPDCVAVYKESIRDAQRIQDTAGEAIVHFNLGSAYKVIPAICNLDAAEAAYQQSLVLHTSNDALGRSRCIKQIGMVHHERFDESRRQGEPAETGMEHFRAAEQHYLGALDLCPPTALTDLAPFHNQLGILYNSVSQIERAREHCEKATEYFEQTGDRYAAGQTRLNMAIMYLGAAERESTLARQRDLLLRAKAYAEAALRDFKHYEGRAADREAKTLQLLADIAEAVTKLS